MLVRNVDQWQQSPQVFTMGFLKSVCGRDRMILWLGLNVMDATRMRWRHWANQNSKFCVSIRIFSWKPSLSEIVEKHTLLTRAANHIIIHVMPEEWWMSRWLARWPSHWWLLIYLNRTSCPLPLRIGFLQLLFLNLWSLEIVSVPHSKPIWHIFPSILYYFSWEWTGFRMFCFTPMSLLNSRILLFFSASQFEMNSSDEFQS